MDGLGYSPICLIIVSVFWLITVYLALYLSNLVHPRVASWVHYCLYVNGLSNRIENSTIFKFADDLKCFKAIHFTTDSMQPTSKRLEFNI